MIPTLREMMAALLLLGLIVAVVYVIPMIFLAVQP